MKSRKVALAITFFSLVVIIFLRRKDSLLNAQPWAEDGEKFISEVLFYGKDAFLRIHAGYYHLIPRIVSYLSVELSIFLGKGIQLVPFFMNLSAIFISSACVLYICLKKYDWIAPFPYRIVASLLIVLIPNYSFEIFGTITNVQWWIGFFQMMITWDMLRNKRMPGYSELSVLFICSFSGPLGIIPVIGTIVVFFFHRSGKNFIFSAVLSIGPVIQIISSLKYRGVMQTDLVKDWIVHFPRLFFGGLFARDIVPKFKLFANYDGFSSLVIIGGVLFAFIFYINKSQKMDITISLGLILSYLLIVYKGAPEWFANYSIPFNDYGGRYLFMPMSIIIVLLIRGLSLESLRISIKISGCILLMLVIIVDVTQFKLPVFTDYQWSKTTAVYSSNGKNVCEVPINPPGWKSKVPCD